ncbi:OmpA family protein [Burkholderia territorii]|nr:OmpA family protein [Burkholderia territorii]
MNLNIMQLMQATLSSDVVKQLADRFHLTPDATQKVVSAATPALLASLMYEGATPERMQSLFSTIMSPRVDSDIAQTLPAMLTDRTQTQRLIDTGRDLFHGMTQNCLPILGSEIARQTGVGEYLVVSMTGLVGTTMLGTLKNHLIQNSVRVEQLPALLEHQLPDLTPHLNNGLMSVLGLGSAKSFVDRMATQLKNVPSSVLHSQQSASESVEVSRDAVQSHAASSPSVARWRWAGLLFLALLTMALVLLIMRCSQKSVPVEAPPVAMSPAEPSVPANSVPHSTMSPHPATLRVQVHAAGQPEVAAVVGSEAEKAQLLDALKQRFGEAHFAEHIAVNPTTQPAAWLAHLDGILPLMAQRGTRVEVDGSRIQLSGPSTSATRNWMGHLQAILGDGYQISALKSAPGEAPASGSFERSIADLTHASGACDAEAVVKVLNMQAIHFMSNSNQPREADAMNHLELSAQALAGCAARGKPVKLEVRGYSDNTGTRQSNLRLSTQRAALIRQALIEKGGAADTLVAVGMGEVDPVASNATQSGRLANRRVEFAASSQ